MVSRELLRLLPLLLCLFVAVPGCGRRETKSPPASAPALPANRAPAPAPGPALPPPGHFVIETSPAGVTVVANQAPRPRLLEELSNRLQFKLVVRGPVDPGPLTVEARELPLEAVLDRVLEGLPFQIAYDVESESGRHVVAAVVLGGSRNGLAQDQGPDGGRERGMRHRGEHRDREAPSAEDLARRKERQQRAEAENSRDLQSSDAGTRATAVAGMRSETENFPKLSELLLHDPSPEVRAAAAERLGGIGTNASVNALVRGLGDPDPQVVRSAIDALSFAGDDTVVPDLKNLLQHPDPSVREAAKQAIESLE